MLVHGRRTIIKSWPKRFIKRISFEIIIRWRIFDYTFGERDQKSVCSGIYIYIYINIIVDASRPTLPLRFNG
jgi:hypothetical protein